MFVEINKTFLSNEKLKFFISFSFLLTAQFFNVSFSFTFQISSNLVAVDKIKVISNEHLRCRKKFYFILWHPSSGKWQMLGHCFEVLHNYVPSTKGIFWMSSCLFMMPISVLIRVRKRKTVIFSGKNQSILS